MKKPKLCRVVNATRDTTVCEKCVVADNMWTRGKGLLGRKSLAEDEGIWLIPGGSIHMFGMKFAIDVLFLTRENVVTDWVENIAPGKMYSPKGQCGKAYSAVEVAPGTIKRSRTEIGDEIRIKN